MKIFQICVGADAHIGPLDTIEFALNFRIIGLCRRGDVGIAPYEPYGRFQKNCKGGRPCPPLGSCEFAEVFRVSEAQFAGRQSRRPLRVDRKSLHE